MAVLAQTCTPSPEHIIASRYGLPVADEALQGGAAGPELVGDFNAASVPSRTSRSCAWRAAVSLAGVVRRSTGSTRPSNSKCDLAIVAATAKVADGTGAATGHSSGTACPANSGDLGLRAVDGVASNLAGAKKTA